MGMSRYGSKRNWPGRKNHAKYVHNLPPLDGASLGDTCEPSMFAWNPRELKAAIPEDENGGGILPHDASSPIATPRVLLGSMNVVLEDVHMNAALRHVRQTVHEAKNLAPPRVYPRLFSQLPENDGRGHTLLQATELLQKGHLNIRHVFDVRQQKVRAQCPPFLHHMRQWASPRHRADASSWAQTYHTSAF